MPKLIDLTGKRIADWMIIQRSHKDQSGNIYYDCLCMHCGNMYPIPASNLRSGRSSKCKNCEKEIRKMNSFSYDPLYRRFRSIISRCMDENHIAFDRYGERGIKLCKLWLKNPKKFIEWCRKNGYSKELHLDRIKNDGNYTPQNCRFVTPKENIRNSTVAKLTPEIVKTIKAMLKLKYRQNYIAKIFGVDYTTICSINIGRTWVDIPSL